MGAAEIYATDLLPGPLARAQSLGATSTIQIGKDVLPENYFDVVFECSGAAPAISAALSAARRAGIIVQVGMLGAGNHQIAIAPLVAKELQLRGTFRFNNEIDLAIAILDENPWIAETVTHVYSLEKQKRHLKWPRTLRIPEKFWLSCNEPGGLVPMGRFGRSPRLHAIVASELRLNQR